MSDQQNLDYHAQVIELFKSGLNPGQIAHATGRKGPAGIGKILKRYGYGMKGETTPRGPVDFSGYRDIIDTYNNEPVYLSDIARKVGLTRERVRQVIEQIHRQSPGLILEGDDLRLRIKIQKQFAAERAKMMVCEICLRSFERNGAQKFCLECRPHVSTWLRVSNPMRHEKHRLAVIRNHMSEADPERPWQTLSARKLFFYWKQFGHLPPPNRDLFVWGESGIYIKNIIGEERWANLQKKMNEYYFDETRRIK